MLEQLGTMLSNPMVYGAMAEAGAGMSEPGSFGAAVGGAVSKFAQQKQLSEFLKGTLGGQMLKGVQGNLDRTMGAVAGDNAAADSANPTGSVAQSSGTAAQTSVAPAPAGGVSQPANAQVQPFDPSTMMRMMQQLYLSDPNAVMGGVR